MASAGAFGPTMTPSLPATFLSNPDHPTASAFVFGVLAISSLRHCWVCFEGSYLLEKYISARCRRWLFEGHWKESSRGQGREKNIDLEIGLASSSSGMKGRKGDSSSSDVSMDSTLNQSVPRRPFRLKALGGENELRPACTCNPQSLAQRRGDSDPLLRFLNPLIFLFALSSFSTLFSFSYRGGPTIGDQKGSGAQIGCDFLLAWTVLTAGWIRFLGELKLFRDVKEKLMASWKNRIERKGNEEEEKGQGKNREREQPKKRFTIYRSRPSPVQELPVTNQATNEPPPSQSLSSTLGSSFFNLTRVDLRLIGPYESAFWFVIILGRFCLSIVGALLDTGILGPLPNPFAAGQALCMLRLNKAVGIAMGCVDLGLVIALLGRFWTAVCLINRNIDDVARHEKYVDADNDGESLDERRKWVMLVIFQRETAKASALSVLILAGFAGWMGLGNVAAFWIPQTFALVFLLEAFNPPSQYVAQTCTCSSSVSVPPYRFPLKKSSSFSGGRNRPLTDPRTGGFISSNGSPNTSLSLAEARARMYAYRQSRSGPPRPLPPEALGKLPDPPNVGDSSHLIRQSLEKDRSAGGLSYREAMEEPIIQSPMRRGFQEQIPSESLHPLPNNHLPLPDDSNPPPSSQGGIRQHPTPNLKANNAKWNVFETGRNKLGAFAGRFSTPNGHQQPTASFSLPDESQTTMRTPTNPGVKAVRRIANVNAVLRDLRKDIANKRDEGGPGGVPEIGSQNRSSNQNGDDHEARESHATMGIPYGGILDVHTSVQSFPNARASSQQDPTSPLRDKDRPRHVSNCSVPSFPATPLSANQSRRRSSRALSLHGTVSSDSATTATAPWTPHSAAFQVGTRVQLRPAARPSTATLSHLFPDTPSTTRPDSKGSKRKPRRLTIDTSLSARGGVPTLKAENGDDFE